MDEAIAWSRWKARSGRRTSAPRRARHSRIWSLQRNIESVVSSLGGKKIFDGRIPEEAGQKIKEWPRDFALKYNSGLGDIWNNPAQVFVVRRADRNIWIHWCSYQFGGGLLIAETKPLEVTAGLLPASEPEVADRQDWQGGIARQLCHGQDRNPSRLATAD